MKTLHFGIIIGTCFLFSIFLITSEHVYAYTCAVKAPSLTTQYYYLHSDAVFVGTVSSITNNTNHQLNVKFDVEKSWKGSQHPTITTYSLVACGYSLVKGEKYLVFATGYPLDYDPWATKPFDNAQDEIALLDNQQFQTQANADEVLYKRLVNARDAISNMVGSKMSQIPISSVGVNDLNFTLDVGIADKKAVTTSGMEGYKQKLEDIVGNVPIRVQYEEYATALPEILTQNTALYSPLKQFKTGISPLNVKCSTNYALVIKAEDGSPDCVKQDTVKKLIERGWATVVANTSDNSVTKDPYEGIDKPSGIILLGNQTYYMTTFNGTLDSIPSSGIDMSFHGVLFTLLRPQESNANGYLYVVDVKFTIDNTNESLVIYPVGIGAVQQDRILSKHTHSQVGFIVYRYNTIKLLVSTDNQDSSALKLFMSTDSDIITLGKSIGVTISVNNTLATPVNIPAQNNWSYPNVSTGPCQTINYGISILDGFYDKNNATQGKSLNLFDPGILCPVFQETAKVYEFQPHSGNVKQVQCKPIEGLQCETGSYQMGQNYKFNGYWDSGMVKPFKSGIYTLVGSDEWGHIAIEHFVVTNSTIFAGDLGTIHCPLFGGMEFGAKIKNSTGFANYYNSTQYGNTFFLHPGMQGTINVQYSAPANAAWFQNNGNAPFNMTNGAALFYMADVTKNKNTISYAVSLYNDETGHHSQICHYGIPYGGFAEPCNSDNKGDIPPSELPDADKLLHPGISTLFEPNSVILYPNSNPVFSATVSANSDVMPGTYWLSLERSLCGPGVLAKLVVLP